jgi:uncharacterized protein YdaU (DUF1376 family)
MEVKATVDEAVGIAKEVHGFWGKLAKMFGGDPTPAAPKPVAKKKEKFVAVDETKVMADVVSQLTEFFKLQEQLAAHIREEEEKSQTVYDPNANLMEAALKRVMAQDQMAALEVTIRETMVYQSPPEMGALYSKVFKMRDTIRKEQEGARKDQEAKERYKQWRRREARRQFLLKEAYLGGTAVLILYIWMWFLFIKK